MSAERGGTIFFAGGGTGGHIFPAVAIAEQVLRRLPDARCVFVCSERPLDTEILRSQRVGDQAAEFVAIPAQPFGVGPRALVRFMRKWGASVRAGRGLIREGRSRGPVVLVALGGFVAAPAAQAARVERAPRLLVNLDAVPGLANRWIARFATRVVTSTPVQGRAWSVVPPIVREGALGRGSAAECRRSLGLDPFAPVLLVTGASQGASSINRFMQAFAGRADRPLSGWQVIHQTGKSDAEECRAAYASAGVPAVVRPFFDGMGTCWGAAEVAVSRAGAGSVAEVWASGVPTLFLPYPYHRDQHQRYNAAPLERAGGALIGTDQIDQARNLEMLGPVLAELLASREKRESLRAGLASLGPADGAARCAAEITGMLVSAR
ncbi:MAG: UDP-N-acetylglucosamine--N-acetylmuramyl-(pentapeptide) pyrophosphoryl-undecaprenol N-acetylglucosamine transferase [Phycisphaerales bacterium]|nr:UDP-N-acetylglucosamine--N-acetylmuramyl-(pentapeptide) pyrophosphoryl-undecaprenol N-acetylglucosamine transferase [Phycisphaerales bacterium]